MEFMRQTTGLTRLPSRERGQRTTSVLRAFYSSHLNLKLRMKFLTNPREASKAEGLTAGFRVDLLTLCFRLGRVVLLANLHSPQLIFLP
jgi:hypothetical protein